VDRLEKLNFIDDTLIYYIIGDNGASAEGTLNGTFNEMINFNGAAAIETAEFLNARIDKLGGHKSYNHYAVGWAHAMNSPYQWTKQVGSHWGGTRNGTIVHWPNGIKGKGEIRTQFHHVIDVAPTAAMLAVIPVLPSPRTMEHEETSSRDASRAWRSPLLTPRSTPTI
jgi:arylsulfatase